MVSEITRWLSLILGLVVTGEALALLVGMNLPSPGLSTWSTFKNNGLVLIDVITGIMIIYFSWRKDIDNSIYQIVILLILILHSYRSWEYIYHPFNMFCVNLPLFIVNNVKLFFSVIVVLFIFLRTK